MKKKKQDSPKITSVEREKIKTEMDKQNDSSQYNYAYIFDAAGVLVSIIGLYYTRKLFMLEQKEYNNEQSVTLQSVQQKKG